MRRARSVIVVLATIAASAVVLLLLNRRMRGNVDYTAAAVWGLVGVYVQQSGWDVPGAAVAAWVALAIALLLVAQTIRLRLRDRDGLVPGVQSPRAGR